MNSKWVQLLALCVGLVAGCRSAQEAASERDTYAVYAALLDSFPATPTHPLRVSASTWPFVPARLLGDTTALYRGIAEDTGVGQPLLHLFDSLNASTVNLRAGFSQASLIHLVSDTIRLSSSGVVGLSRVAFAHDRGRALVAVVQTCKPDCSWWALYLVMREHGKWRTARRLMLGTS